MTRKFFLTAISTIAITLAFAWPHSTPALAQTSLPVITGFTPFNAPPGTLISIFGRNLGGAISVSFNSANAQFRVITSDFLQATVPSNAGTGPITVVTRFGTARSGAFFTSTQQGGPIEIQILSPAAGRVGTAVTITGRNFIGARVVRFNGVPARFFVVSSNQIIAYVPFGATTGPIRIEGASGIATSNAFFNVAR